MGIAVQKKIRIYCIGVGTDGKAPFLVGRDIFGRDVYRHYKVNFDEKILRRIAEKTGGLYFKAEETAGLQKIYDKINELEKTEAEVETFAEYREIYSYFLISALILLLLWAALVNTRFLSIP